ncbi:RHS repeat domain-containing protein [Pseudomonas shirazensis]|uniref:RHS repeat domain-containing protein n=1 Tax=Pseudomonas shirazensis TaxID=2745494 RepID=UPI003D2AC959
MSAHVVGQQTFDGLGRQLSITVGGRLTHSTYVAGQLAPSANILPDNREIGFEYVHSLEDQLKEVRPADEPVETFDYHPQLGVRNHAKGSLGDQNVTFSTDGLRATDIWNVDKDEHITHWRHSLGGVLLGYEDSSNAEHKRYHDVFGRLERMEVGEISCQIGYNEFSLPCSYTTIDSASGNQLLQTVSYDSLNREHIRSFVATTAGISQTYVQTLTYTDLDQLKSRHWKEDARQGEETFSYDLLGRLRTYTADGTIAPEDPFGNRIVEQVFTLNMFDGYERVITTFIDGSRDEACFSYDNPQDPCQVSAISHSHPSWPAAISLDYDACGRLQADSLGRRLSWDVQGRLKGVDYRGKTCTYGYDPSGNLCDRTVDTKRTRSFHNNGVMTHEQCGDDVVHMLRDAGQLFALARLSSGIRQGNATLIGCDAQGSVRLEVDLAARTRHYTAHGAAPTEEQAGSPYGFAGERREPLTGWYMAGGFRPYDPVLMMFIAPDSLSKSPFGQGGVNPYSYCAGDPVNRIDPDGQSWWPWLIAGFGIVSGFATIVASFGAAAPAGAAIIAATNVGVASLTVTQAVAIGVAALSAVSISTGAAASVGRLVDSEWQGAAILGYISGAIGLVTGVYGMRHILSKVGEKIGRAARVVTHRLNEGSRYGLNAAPLPSNLSAKFFVNYDTELTPAFLTRSNLSGKLMGLDGEMYSPEKLAQRLLEPSITANALAGATDTEGALLLAADYAGISGTAQRLSKTLGMPVIAPVGKMTVPIGAPGAPGINAGVPFSNFLSTQPSLPPGLPVGGPQELRVHAVWNIYLPHS